MKSNYQAYSRNSIASMIKNLILSLYLILTELLPLMVANGTMSAHIFKEIFEIFDNCQMLSGSLCHAYIKAKKNEKRWYETENRM